MTERAHDDQELLAAEYVLGTLDADERARARALSAIDKGFAALVHAWERRLGELNVLVAPVEPPADIRDRIREAIGASALREEPQAPPLEPAPELVPQPTAEHMPAPTVEETPSPAIEEVPAPTIEEVRAPVVASREEARVGSGDDELQRLRGSVRRWRKVAFFLLLLAFAVAGLGYVRETRPEYLPPDLRPTTRTVEVTKNVEIPSPKPAQYVAILDKEGVQPAFLLSFDLERRTVMVRNVSAPTHPGKSYELWLMSSKFSAPRSLGVIRAEEYSRPELASYDAVTLNSATYGISLEPEGGSRSGKPSGPMLYSGKLVQVTPVGFRNQSP